MAKKNVMFSQFDMHKKKGISSPETCLTLRHAIFLIDFGALNTNLELLFVANKCFWRYDAFLSLFPFVNLHSFRQKGIANGCNGEDLPKKKRNANCKRQSSYFELVISKLDFQKFYSSAMAAIHIGLGLYFPKCALENDIFVCF